MKGELEGEIMTAFAALSLKTYFYLLDDGNSDKKSIETKKKGAKT